MARELEVLGKLRQRLDDLGGRIEERVPDLDPKRVEELRAEVRVVRERLQAAFAQGAEVAEETVRSVGRSIEHLAERFRQLQTGDS